MQSILSERENCQKQIYYCIANGNSIRIWLDPWFNLYVLYNIVENFRAECPSRKEARSSSLIVYNHWNVTTPRSTRLLEIFKVIPSIPIHYQLNKDEICWQNLGSKVFSIKIALENLSMQNDINCVTVVWFNSRIPPLID